MDIIALLVALLAPVAVFVGMFASPNLGSGMPMKNWFAWHPVLMTLAFPCLMTLGRWSYISESLPDKDSKRSAHRYFMIFGSSAAVLGYSCIFMAHLEKRSFFGYDFKSHAWASPSRVAHDIVGYLTLLLILAQSPMGLAKLKLLRSTGERIFTFHGTLGKVIMILATANILIACSFWGWHIGMKIAVGGLSVAAMLLATVWPKPEGGEGTKLLDGHRGSKDAEISLTSA